MDELKKICASVNMSLTLPWPLPPDMQKLLQGGEIKVPNTQKQAYADANRAARQSLMMNTLSTSKVKSTRMEALGSLAWVAAQTYTQTVWLTSAAAKKEGKVPLPVPVYGLWKTDQEEDATDAYETLGADPGRWIGKAAFDKRKKLDPSSVRNAIQTYIFKQLCTFLNDDIIKQYPEHKVTNIYQQNTEFIFEMKPESGASIQLKIEIAPNQKFKQDHREMEFTPADGNICAGALAVVVAFVGFAPGMVQEELAQMSLLFEDTEKIPITHIADSVLSTGTWPRGYPVAD